MKSLLEKITKFAGEPEQKPGDQVRGSEKAKKSDKDHPFKGRLVGDSRDNMLKGLAQIAESQNIEWKLAEMWANFNEEDLGVEPKRPGRKSDRPARKYAKDGQLSNRYTPVSKEETDESRGHKVIASKLKNIERSSKPLADVDLTAREAQAKAEYRKYVEKMKKLNPNFIPLYKIDEYGADQPTGTAAPGSNLSTKDPKQLAAIAQATNTLKAATGSSAANTNIAKAIDAASQGQAVGSTDMKIIEPMIDVIGQAAQDPKLATQFKTLAAQAKQSALNQQQK